MSLFSLQEHFPETNSVILSEVGVPLDFENIDWILKELDLKKEPLNPFKLGNLPQCFEWSGRTGKRKLQPFWAYCEESQHNYVKFNMHVPHFPTTSATKICKSKASDTYLLVENHLHQQSRTCVISNLSLPPCIYRNSEYYVVNHEEIIWKLDLVSDDEIPVHPQQGDASLVNTNIIRLDTAVPDLFEIPLGMFFQINFTGRVRGFFKLKMTLYHQNIAIFTTYSETFMMNNPRMKRIQEHKLYSCKELKFMRLFALHCQKNEFPDISTWKEIGKDLQFQNISKLLSQAANLFPKPVRYSQNNKSKNHSNYK